MKRCWFPALLVAVLCSGCPKPAVQVKVETERFRVAGGTGPDIRRSLNQHRTLSRRDAMAVWFFRVRHEHSKDSTGCRAVDVHVVAYLTLERPTWSPPPSATKRLRAEWDRYAKALASRHEQRRRIIDRFARKLYRQLRRLAQPTCEALDSKADRLERQIFAEHNAAQEALLRMQRNPTFH
jgi:predicted secreted Zn-dependent protease